MTQSISSTSPWFPYPARESAERMLFCLPAAGGAASGFRQWLRPADRRVRVVPVQLPGREARLSDPLVTDARELVARLVEPVLAAAGDRFALFGHSMGAVLALDLAHALTARGHPPEHLVVSGHVPPHLTHLGPTDVPVRSMTEDDLRDYLATEAGTPEEILAMPDLMELVLPVLRADLLVCESFDHGRRPPLPVPITAFAGADDPRAPYGLLARWAELTTAGFRVRLFPGGHGYLNDDPAGPADAVRAGLLDPPNPEP